MSVSRQGINLSDDALVELDNLVSPLIKNGQTIRNIDLPRRVRYSKRKEKQTFSKDTTIRKGRTYEDFQKYLLENPDTSVVEMDTVESKKGGKVLLTFLFRNSKLMLAFLLNDKTTDSVRKIFNWLENILGNTIFEKTFSVILTDNGAEFSNPLSLEFNYEGIGRTRIFFCNSGASYQKGAIEKNHEFIRYVIPNEWNLLKKF